MKLYWKVECNGKTTWRLANVKEVGDDDDLDPLRYQWYLVALEEEE